MKKALILLPFLVLSVDTHASTAYGTLNNFDTVNDTGVPCHGFEIEIDDVHSTDVTYTYDYNHYGAPKITEDHNDPAHPNRVFIRYESQKDSAGNYLAYTEAAAPGAIAPTDGHQCTNPLVNLGCEHFGVGYYGGSTVKYNWLIDDGSGNLVHGPAVNVATPTWTYIAPAPNQPAQVIAKVVAPPDPPEIEDPENKIEFGDAVWLKQIITTSHSKEKVELKDLVSDDPDDPDDKNWTNGKEDEVEVETEWELQQKDFKKVDGGNNNELEGAPEEYNPDEVVTRRYEFYKYIGEFDPETNEALCDNQADCPDAVGDYIGAQMAAFNAEAPLGLIDNLQAGNYQEAYVARTVVIGGNTPYVIEVTDGSLPGGLSFNSDGILSGTPQQSGNFTFTVKATDTSNTDIGHVAGTVSKAYTLKISAPAIAKGDLDSDGDIDLNDLNILKGKFGQKAGEPYDMNGDGTINVIDFRKAVLLCTRQSCAVN